MSAILSRHFDLDDDVSAFELYGEVLAHAFDLSADGDVELR